MKTAHDLCVTPSFVILCSRQSVGPVATSTCFLYISFIHIPNPSAKSTPTYSSCIQSSSCVKIKSRTLLFRTKNHLCRNNGRWSRYRLASLDHIPRSTMVDDRPDTGYVAGLSPLGAATNLGKQTASARAQKRGCTRRPPCSRP